MIPDVADRADDLELLCVRYNVLRLDLFGSAATGEHHPGKSDLDFVVEFREMPDGGYAHAYFGLLEALETLFGSSVDLLEDSAIINPYFRESVEESRIPLYAA